MRKTIAAAALLILTGAAAQAQSSYDPAMNGYGAAPQGYAGYGGGSAGPEYRHPVVGYDQASRGPNRIHSAYGPRVRWHAGYAAGYAGGTAGYQPYPTPGYDQGIPVVSDVAAAGVTTVAGIVGFGLGGFSNWGDQGYGDQGYGHAYVGHCGCRNGWNF